MAFISYIIYMGRMLASSGKANWIGMQNVLPSDTSLTDFDSTLFQQLLSQMGKANQEA